MTPHQITDAAARARAALAELANAAATDDVDVHLQLLRILGGDDNALATAMGAVLETVAERLAALPEDVHPEAVSHLDFAATSLADVAGQDGILAALNLMDQP
ncbi:hypothetical protein [Streptacidiphilus sp. EB103A]|uniref:hypothetical protein n=1 Tax=Streptacidiphilus sp. EB103A TaxID=3156275 RepID=UPI003517655E